MSGQTYTRRAVIAARADRALKSVVGKRLTYQTVVANGVEPSHDRPTSPATPSTIPR
jgi:hypothetical protein